jgi:NADH-quinone oxidoreductase subunit N
LNFDLVYISPELILAAGGILVLLAGLTARKWTAPGRITPFSPEVLSLAVLTAALASSVVLLTKPAVSRGMTQFGGVMAVDQFAVFFKIIALISTIIVVFLAIDYFRGVRVHRGEFYALLIFAALAVNSLAASTDLIMIYLSLEFLSITSYILVGYLKQDPRSNEAAVKYFLYGAVAAAVMLYGMTMLYGVTGMTNTLGISSYLGQFDSGHVPLHILFLALLMMLIGFGFKVAMVPFHQWAPDAYEGAPTPITAFLSVASKAAGFAVLIRMLATTLVPQLIHWGPVMMILSGLTMTVGNLTAIPQLNIKRMLAYSSIGQAGYLLLGVAAIPYSQLAIPATLLYLFIYLFMNLGAFAVVTMVSARINSDDIRDYAGLMKRSPMAAVAMVFFMLSLAGIPPTAGFLAKFRLFSAAIEPKNQHLLTLAIIAIANTVVSVYYYMNVVRYMFFVEPTDAARIAPSRAMSLVICLMLIATIVMLLYPDPFIEVARRSSAMLAGM